MSLPEHTDHERVRLEGTRAHGLFRLVLALFQGGLLYWLWRSASQTPLLWPANQPVAFAALALVLGFVPPMLMAGVGRIGYRALGLWAALAAVLVAMVGAYAAHQTVPSRLSPPYLGFAVILACAGALFIGHHLVVPGLARRRWVADYQDYFDTAWKAGVQLALCVGFVGLFWLLLFLGANLFRLIGLSFLEDLLDQKWFSIPLTTLVFAAAVHLTDVSGSLIRGVRTVALMLLSWLLLVIVVLVGGFLLALPFTGLDGLWSAGSGTTLVLSAAAFLIILINTAYQDGHPDRAPAPILIIGVRVAGVLLVPLIVIAVWGLALRIGQHGLTPSRIIASASALVGGAYAAGYAFAALSPMWRPQAWMKPLEKTNVAAAVLTVGLILALFSPLLDPARLSVANQVKRLESGLISANDFDYDFLRLKSGKTGLAALNRLAHSQNLQIAKAATEAVQTPETYSHTPIGSAAAISQVERLTTVDGSTLPDSFLEQAVELRALLNACNGELCKARQMDLDQDGIQEVLIAASHQILIFTLEPDGRWRERGQYMPPLCGPSMADLGKTFEAGELRSLTSPMPELEINGVRLRALSGVSQCEG